jgi:hypothetical protein
MSLACFSSLGLERAASITDTDFTFIGNTCGISCTGIQAAFISSNVHARLEGERSVDSFPIQCQTPGWHEERIDSSDEQPEKVECPRSETTESQDQSP